eukprot:343672_1
MGGMPFVPTLPLLPSLNPLASLPQTQPQPQLSERDRARLEFQSVEKAAYDRMRFYKKNQEILGVKTGSELLDILREQQANDFQDCSGNCLANALTRLVRFDRDHRAVP